MAQRTTHPILGPTQKNSLLVVALYTYCFAFLAPDASQLFPQYGQLLVSQTYLIRDFTAIAGLAATFFNVASHLVVAYLLMRWNTRSKLSGMQLAATGIFVGHSFFGTHLLNILPIIYGVYLYSRWTGQSFSSYATVSLFATAAAPLVSFWALSPGLNWWSVLLAALAGMAIGFISPPLAEQFLKFHQGFSLYNFGFTMGMIATFASISFNYFQLEVPSVTLLNDGDQGILFLYIAGIVLGLLLLGARRWPEVRRQYPKLWRRAGRTPDDFYSHFGYATTCFNMGLNGALYLLIGAVLGANLNGVILGALLSLMGFSAFGKHPRNCLPISAGVLLAATLLGQDLSQSSVLIPLIFGTTLAPIAGYYGIIYGALAGFLHYNMVSIVLDLHEGMSLYNNGFAGGFVAAFLVPIYDTLRSSHHAYDD